MAQVSFELGAASRPVLTLQDAQTLAKPSLDKIPIFGVSAVTVAKACCRNIMWVLGLRVVGERERTLENKRTERRSKHKPH